MFTHTKLKFSDFSVLVLNTKIQKDHESAWSCMYNTGFFSALFLWYCSTMAQVDIQDFFNQVIAIFTPQDYPEFIERVRILMVSPIEDNFTQREYVEQWNDIIQDIVLKFVLYKEELTEIDYICSVFENNGFFFKFNH